MHKPQKRRQTNHIRLLLGTKAVPFYLMQQSPHHCTTAYVPVMVKMRVLTKRKNRDTMKITLNLACRLFLCIFGCGFVLFFSLPLSHRRKSPQLASQLSLQRRILSQAINVHHYTA